MNLSFQVMRHLKAWGLTLGVALLIWTVQYWHTYIGPSAIAKADDGRFLIGSVISLVMTAIILAIIFLPAIAIGAVARKLLDLRKWTELFIALICGSVISCSMNAWFYKEMTTHAVPDVGESLKGFGIYLAVPMCLYWLFTRNQKQRADKPPHPAAPTNGN